jgi:hypothetical protein
MTNTTIDHITLIQLVEAGSLCSARAVAQHGGWGIVVADGATERILTVRRTKEARIFRKLETLVSYLKGVGIPRVDVVAMNLAPHGIIANGRATSDTRAESTYTEWLKAEIQEAIDDTSPTVSHEEAMRQVRAAIKR